jgi:uncharacterized damage-inducible protein DinB
MRKNSLLLATLKYKHWADRRTIDAVGAMNEIEHAPFLAFARQQLNHMIRVEELFKSRLLGLPEPHASTNTVQIPELANLDQRITISNLWLTSYAEGLKPFQLEERLSFQFVDGERGNMTRHEIFFHIVNHGTYHRGAIGYALDLARTDRPADTYTVFIHAAEPQRRKMA